MMLAVLIRIWQAIQRGLLPIGRVGKSTASPLVLGSGLSGRLFKIGLLRSLL